jgi:transcriptional regulator with XRE-family HTH domain
MGRLGNYLRERREGLGLTLEDVGNHVGVGKSVVSKWERGVTRKMHTENMEKLSEILQIPVNTIVNYGIVDSIEDDAKAEILSKLNTDPEYYELIESCLSIPKEKIGKAVQLLKVLVD